VSSRRRKPLYRHAPKRKASKASGSKPAYLVRSGLLQARRCITFADARRCANQMMDSGTTSRVIIEGPTGKAEFARHYLSEEPGADLGPWILDHSLLEELPMPGGEDL
jgi:hypothetical protein